MHKSSRQELKLLPVFSLFFIVAISAGGGVVSAWPQGMTVWHRQNAVVDDAGHQIIGPQRAVRSSPPIPPHGQDPRLVMDEQSWAAPSYGYSGLADHPGAAAAAEYASEPVYGMQNEPLAETCEHFFSLKLRAMWK